MALYATLGVYRKGSVMVVDKRRTNGVNKDALVYMINKKGEKRGRERDTNDLYQRLIRDRPFTLRDRSRYLFRATPFRDLISVRPIEVEQSGDHGIVGLTLAADVLEVFPRPSIDLDIDGVFHGYTVYCA